MMLCDKLRKIRELKVLPQRKVAAALDIDTATYCKIEKGIMRPKREHLPILAHLFGIDEADLLKQWLAEKINSVIQNDENFATEALLIANKILESNDKAAPLRVFEGFAGYGGASFALKRSGVSYKVVGMSENDKFASALLAQNFPDVKNWGDITTLDPQDLPDFDLFTGGFPCQPFSSAGLQHGVNDKYGRGVLFWDIIRICEAKQPEYILLENVKGLKAKKFEKTFETILSELKRIGYPNAVYSILNSKNYGIPQNRERLWIFAKKGGLPKGFNLTPPARELTATIGDFLDRTPPSSMYLSQEQISHLKFKHNIESFRVETPLCFDVYNKKIKTDGICITITQPEHNSLRVVEVPEPNGLEIVRKMSIDEQLRLMGFEDGELNYAGQSYTQMSRRAGNGWDVNLAGILIKHIFDQLCI